jgi:hypothetical protein
MSYPGRLTGALTGAVQPAVRPGRLQASGTVTWMAGDVAAGASRAQVLLDDRAGRRPALVVDPVQDRLVSQRERAGPGDLDGGPAGRDPVDRGRAYAQGPQGRGPVEVLPVGVAEAGPRLEDGHAIEGQPPAAAAGHPGADREVKAPFADRARGGARHPRHRPLVAVALGVHPLEQPAQPGLAAEPPVEQVVVLRVRREAREHPVDDPGAERRGETVGHVMRCEIGHERHPRA